MSRRLFRETPKSRTKKIRFEIPQPQSMVIPNELIIYINTGISGSKKIKYSPQMTVKNTNSGENSVLFNPLVKLNETLIKKIPENLRKKEFFNRGLFDYIIYNSQKVKTLQEATKNGLIDNNIQITLNTLFPENSVIYINNNPYVIIDTDWTTGDWKIDTKQKELYNSFLKEEIITGVKQLQNLPEELVYGPNYNGPPNKVSSKKLEPAPAAVAPTAPVAAPSTGLVASPTGPVASPTGPVASPRGPVAPLTRPVAPTGQRIGPNGPPPTASVLPPVPTSGPLASTTGPLASPTGPVASPTGPVAPTGEQIGPYGPPPLPQQVTEFLRGYFGRIYYYNLVNYIYQNLEEKPKKFIIDLFNKTTRVNFEDYNNEYLNINMRSYMETVNALSDQYNSGKGDCYFIAVSEAINSYNFYNQKNDRIIKNGYGVGDRVFTPLYLRRLVYEYLIEQDLSSFLSIAETYANDLNNSWNTIIYENNNPKIDSKTYMENLDGVFKQHENFLVKKPSRMPDYNTSDYKNPFRVIRNDEIQGYIESSDYWADQLATDALCNKLKLNVITIEKNRNNILRCSYGMLYDTQDTSWDKYLFLYFNSAEGHYELLTFTYYVGRPKREKIYSIFKKERGALPPLYILIIMYFKYFSFHNDENKFTFLPEIMDAIDKSFLKIIKDTPRLLPLFKNYFPEQIREEQIQKIQNGQNGGFYGYDYTPHGYGYASYGYPPYGYRPYDYNITKGSDKPNIAYYITIDMELYPGTELTPEQLKEAQCTQKKNSINKSFSQLIGKKYVIPSIKNKTVKKVNKNQNYQDYYGNPNYRDRYSEYPGYPNYRDRYSGYPGYSRYPNYNRTLRRYY